MKLAPAKLPTIGKYTECGIFILHSSVLLQIVRTHPESDCGKFVIRGREV